MVFQAGTQRDERRRLLLCEPTGTGQAQPVRKRCRRKRPLLLSPHYGDAAFLEHIPRLTDLIPRAIWPYGVALVLGLGMIGGLEWLYAGLMPQLRPWTTDGVLETFDLNGKGTLAGWFSSTTLLLASGTALIVYLVRRYRRDDYQGRYRIWLWAAGCWLLLSLDSTANLHRGFQEMMVGLTGQRLGGDGSLWWVAACFFLLGGVGVRLLADMRECLLSCMVFGAAALSYAAAVVVRLQWVVLPSDTQAVMVQQGAAMLGHWLLLVAMALHARHVLLDAEGRLAPPDPTPSPAPLETSDAMASGSALQASGGASPTSGDSTLTVHAAHGTSVATAPGLGASAGSGLTVSTGAVSPSAGGGWWSGANTASTTLASSGSGSASGSPSGGSSGQSGMSQAGSATTSLGPAGTSPWPSAPRRLTEAEKKALRRKLEKLRKQREAQG